MVDDRLVASRISLPGRRSIHDGRFRVTVSGLGYRLRAGKKLLGSVPADLGLEIYGWRDGDVDVPTVRLALQRL